MISKGESPFQFIAWLCGALMLQPPALNAADVYLQIQRGEKVMVALPGFVLKENNAATLALSQEIRDTAKNDILFTRLFNLVESGPPMDEGKIDFKAWESLGADLLIRGNISLKNDEVTLMASVYEVQAGNPVFQKKYTTPSRNAAQIAHEFVADFIFRFTGNRGVSSSRIVFSNNTTGDKELYIIDYDGKRQRKLTSDKSVSILPRWSPDRENLLYTTYRKGNPDLALYSFKTGKSTTFSGRRGLNTSGSFSPDGKQIVATLSYQGYTNLYLLDLTGKILRRLTNTKSSHTSATFSADGRKIIFVSDRSGGPQIYMMDADGSNLERVTNGGWCDAPAWSPLGDKIAYSRGDSSGAHHIVVQDLSTGKSYSVTSESGKNENPSFSPDGRFIAYASKSGGRSQIFIASVDGTIRKKLGDIPGASATPAWEP